MREFDDEKILMMKTQFEIKIVQFYVLEGKKIKIILIIGPKIQKILDIKAKKYRTVSKKTLKNTLIFGLKIWKSGR